MTKHVPIMLFLFAAASVGLTFFGGEYSRLESIKASLGEQRQANEGLREKVVEMKREATLLQTDARALEKAARGELGMARAGEVIVFFEDEDETSRTKPGPVKNDKPKSGKSVR